MRKQILLDRFSANLRNARARVGISQEELAFRAGIHRTQISLMESGSRLPRLETLLKLEGALELQHGALMEGMTYQPNVWAQGGFRIEGGD